MLLTLVRHGETEWNRAGRIQGSTDIPLNELGREQARMAGELLARRSWDAVYTSPLRRAVETAEIVAGVVGSTPPIAVPALVERNYGEAEGLSDRELAERFPLGAEVPGREPRERLAGRVMTALAAIGDAHPGEAIVAVTHGGVIRAVLGVVDPGGDHGRISNASVHTFEYGDGDWRLIAFDDRLDEQSEALGTMPLVAQNAVERRDDGGRK